jgi:hypothetical protein
MLGDNHLRLVILDACRDNPFVRSMRRTLATRTVRSGYGEIDERSLPPNTLVAYAQRAGATAEDGVGANSPYTTALLKHLLTPGLDVELKEAPEFDRINSYMNAGNKVRERSSSEAILAAWALLQIKNLLP